MTDIILTDEEGEALVRYFGTDPDSWLSPTPSALAALAKRWQDAQPRPFVKGDIVHSVTDVWSWTARMTVEHVMPEHCRVLVIDGQNYPRVYPLDDLAHGERPT